jgi:hypothetical protein
VYWIVEGGLRRTGGMKLLYSLGPSSCILLPLVDADELKIRNGVASCVYGRRSVGGAYEFAAMYTLFL